MQVVLLPRHRERAGDGSNDAIAFTAFLLLVTVVMLAATFGLRASSASVPRMVSVPVAALLCYRLIPDLRDRDRNLVTGPEETAARSSDELTAIRWLHALPVVSMILGFVAGPALIKFGWARFRAEERTAVAVAAAIFTAVAVLVLLVGGFRW